MLSLYTVLYCTVLYCTVLHWMCCTGGAVLCTILYCTVLDALYCTGCTVLYCTVLYCTVLSCPIHAILSYSRPLLFLNFIQIVSSAILSTLTVTYLLYLFTVERFSLLEFLHVFSSSLFLVFSYLCFISLSNCLCIHALR
jgi:hypothetical protein